MPDARPYSADEERVATWLRQIAPNIGTGDDPIGFVLASHDLVVMQRNAAQKVCRDLMDAHAAGHCDLQPLSCAAQEALEI